MWLDRTQSVGVHEVLDGETKSQLLETTRMSSAKAVLKKTEESNEKESVFTWCNVPSQ